MSNSSKIAKDILAFQPDAVELEHKPVPGKFHWTLYVILAFLVTVIVWACLAQVDRVVVARGKVITTLPRLTVQPLSPLAIIEKIHVQIGDVVSSGQSLVTLDQTFTKADLNSIRLQMENLDEQIHRLGAESSENGYKPKNNSTAGRLQDKLFQNKKQEYSSKMEEYFQQISDLRIATQKNGTAIKSLTKQLKIAQNIEQMYRYLYKKSHATRLQHLQARSKLLNISSQLEGLQSEKQSIIHKIKRTSAERNRFESEWKKQIHQQLSQARQKYQQLMQEEQKAKRTNSLITLTAPSDGVVLEIANRSQGSIVRAAEVLVSLVPLKSKLEIEVEVPAKDIGRIRVGDEARIKFDAFPFQRHGTLAGEVSVISEDAFTQTSPAAPKPANYRSRLHLLETTLRDVPQGFRLMPGMEVTTEIKVGKRRIISYLIYPIIRAIGESMREP